MSQSVLPAREDGVVRIEALDGLRGVAAIVVVLYHALLIVPEFSASIVDGVEPLAGTPEWALLRTPLRILVMGPEAVLIFFVLSGFVLTLGFVGRPMSSRFVGSYLIRRVLRLYIPVWGSLIFAFVLALAVPRNVDAASSWLASHPDASIGDLLKDGLLLLGTSNLNSPLWSLVWEVWFSLLLPVIWLVFRVARVERWWIGAVLLLLFLSFLAQFPEVRAAMPVSHVTGGLLRYLPVFCIGMIIALKLDALRAWYERAHSAVRGGAWTLVGVLLFVPALFEPFAESAPLVRGEFWVLSLLGCAGLVALVTGLRASRWIPREPGSDVLRTALVQPVPRPRAGHRGSGAARRRLGVVAVAGTAADRVADRRRRDDGVLSFRGAALDRCVPRSRESHGEGRREEGGMTPLDRTALIVVSYGSAGLVEENIAALAGDRPELDVVIVDSFTSPGERERVRDLCARRGWTPVLLDSNAGFGGGVNAGAAVALERGADVLIVLNPDAVLGASDAEKLADAVAADRMLLAAPVIQRPDGSLWTAGTDLYLDDGTMAGVRHRDRHAGRPRELWVSGACFALSRTLWERVGGFDDVYFLYWEDVDLSRRVRDAGGRIRVLDSASAVHDEGGTHDDRRAGRGKSETYYYFNIRNRLLFARLRLDSETQRRWRASDRRVSWGIILQGGRRQLFTSLAPWRALRTGLRDGRRGISGPAPR